MYDLGSGCLFIFMILDSVGAIIYARIVMDEDIKSGNYNGEVITKHGYAVYELTCDITSGKSTYLLEKCIARRSRLNFTFNKEYIRSGSKSVLVHKSKLLLLTVGEVWSCKLAS